MALVQKFTLVLPQTLNSDNASILSALGDNEQARELAQIALIEAIGDEHDKIEVYSGVKSVKNYGITVQGSGSFARGQISGSLTTYDYKALYKVYGLTDSESANYWFISYKKERKHDELKQVFAHSETLTTNYNVDFQIQGNDYGINSVFITFQVIRLQLNGQTKDYVVSNSNSAGAVTPSGSPYPGEFKPV
jgi:hypothetical protein